MEDFNSASMDSVATADSGYENPVTSASDDVAGMDTSGQPLESVNTDSAIQESIDAGWSWDDDDAAPTSDDTDEDMDALSQDPNLDQTKVPGLVQALRSARTAERERTKALRQMENQFEAYGGAEGALQSLQLVNTLFSGQPEGTTEFLTALYDNAQPAYADLVTRAIEFNPDYAIAQLQQMGRLPADLGEVSQASGSLDAETLASIPEYLRATAQALPASVMDDLLLQTDEVRNYHLEREMRMQQLDNAQRQQAEQQYQAAYQQAYQTGQQQAIDLTQQYEKAHLSQLAKWEPFGPGDETKDQNQAMYSMVLEGAMAKVLGDQKFARMYADAAQLLQNAPVRSLQGERLVASQDERKGRALAAQFNARLGQVLREQVKTLNEVFKGYRAYQQISGQMPNRREIQGSTVSSGTTRGALGPDGKASPDFLESLAAQINFPS
jgi:hypothetical protein